MKILFLYPNAGSQLGFNYGIAHLSAVLKQAGHDVALWQLCDDIEPLPSEEQFISRLRQESADIIGFSVVTNQWAYAKKLASWARKATEVPLVCGGIHTMAAAEEILRSQVFDFIIRGEAEEELRIRHIDQVADLACFPSQLDRRRARAQHEEHQARTPLEQRRGKQQP